MIPKKKIAVEKKKRGRPSAYKTTLAILRHMLTVPKREGRYDGDRVPLPVKTVADWLNVTPDCVRCIERGKPGYRLTPENAELLSNQTSVSESWLLSNSLRSKPLNWYNKPFSQADFDNRQIELTKCPREVRQQMVSLTFARNAALIAEILLCAAKQKKFDACAARLKTELGKLYYSLTEKPVSLVGKAILTTNTKGIRRALESLADGFQKRLKII